MENVYFCGYSHKIQGIKWSNRIFLFFWGLVITSFWMVDQNYKKDMKLYDQFAEGWWNPGEKFFALAYLNKPRFEFFDTFVPNFEGLKILDVGCGGGFASEYLAKRGAKVVGIDQSPGLIETAKKHAHQEALVIDYHQGVAEKLPFEANSFDAVLCVDVLEHVHDLPKAIEEMNRVLKKGGIFLFDTINRTWKSKVIMIWMLEHILKQIPKGVHQWKKFIKPNDLSQLLDEKGFSNLEMQGFSIKGKNPLSGEFKVSLSQDFSVMYIGKAVKD